MRALYERLARDRERADEAVRAADRQERALADLRLDLAAIDVQGVIDDRFHDGMGVASWVFRKGEHLTISDKGIMAERGFFLRDL